jgi:hypothetical protein
MVAVLFARRDSIYKRSQFVALAGLDVYDIDRDARTWPGGCPVIAHPPCRSWGRLRHFARAPEGEHELGFWAVEQVRQYGGVLEHPASSTLWPAAELPKPGEFDSFNGWTLAAPQWWWGHRARKDTLFYIRGVGPDEIPPLPFRLGQPSHVVQSRKRGSRPHIPKAERERTPFRLAIWLVDLARRVHA